MLKHVLPDIMPWMTLSDAKRAYDDAMRVASATLGQSAEPRRVLVDAWTTDMQQDLRHVFAGPCFTCALVTILGVDLDSPAAENAALHLQIIHETAFRQTLVDDPASRRSLKQLLHAALVECRRL